VVWERLLVLIHVAFHLMIRLIEKAFPRSKVLSSIANLADVCEFDGQGTPRADFIV
jgi:hypothetical protein